MREHAVRNEVPRLLPRTVQEALDLELNIDIDDAGDYDSDCGEETSLERQQRHAARDNKKK